MGIVMFVTAVVFLLMSLAFFRGRGAFLISGYNTASPSEKARYKLKRLMRVMGVGVGLISLVTFVAAFGEGFLDEAAYDTFYVGYSVVVVIVALVMVVSANTYAKIRPNETPDE